MIDVESIRAAAERLTQEAVLHKAAFETDPMADDILLVSAAALTGLDLYAEVERLKEENGRLRREQGAMSE